MNELFWKDFWSNHGGTTGDFLDREASDLSYEGFTSDDEEGETATQEARSMVAADEWCRRNLRRERDNAACAVRR